MLLIAVIYVNDAKLNT